MSSKKREVWLVAEPTELSETRRLADEAAASYGLKEPERFAFAFAVNEAVSNAIEHGSPSPEGTNPSPIRGGEGMRSSSVCRTSESSRLRRRRTSSLPLAGAGGLPSWRRWLTSSVSVGAPREPSFDCASDERRPRGAGLRWPDRRASPARNPRRAVARLRGERPGGRSGQNTTTADRGRSETRWRPRPRRDTIEIPPGTYSLTSGQLVANTDDLTLRNLPGATSRRSSPRATSACCASRRQRRDGPTA